MVYTVTKLGVNVSTQHIVSIVSILFAADLQQQFLKEGDFTNVSPKTICETLLSTRPAKSGSYGYS